MISVCMATYNGERFLREQIDSILCQLGPADELIISDDGSTDGTLGIIESYGDSRIRLLKHERTFSVSKFSSGYYCSNNFSNAISHAQGDLIFLSDQDDKWRDNKIEVMKSQLESADLCLSNFAVVDENGKTIRPKFFMDNPITRHWFVNFNRNIYFGCCMAFRKATVESFMPIPPSVASYDSWIGAVLHLKKKKICFIDIALINYRRHEYNISFASEKSRNPLLFKIKWRIQFLKALLQFFMTNIASNRESAHE